MSVRRKPGEIVKRAPGSGWGSSGGILETAELIRVPVEPDYSEPDPCLMGCGDPACREWPNWEIIGNPDGECVYHVSECQVTDHP
jgi:hypothetical protein